MARGDICIHVGVSTDAHRLCRVLIAFLFELPVSWYEPAARKGVECRLGGSIIKIASRSSPSGDADGTVVYRFEKKGVSISLRGVHWCGLSGVLPSLGYWLSM